jgi:hypothetical protein
LKEYLNQVKNIKHLLNNGINRIKFHKVNLDINDDSVVFCLGFNGFLGNKYLLIKHHNTGKRISKPVKRNSNKFEVELSNPELENMGETGIFDIYLKTKFGRSEFIERTKFESINENKLLINKKGKNILRPYKTDESNLSFTLEKALFNYEITSIDSYQNQMLIIGFLNLFEDILFDSVELALKSDEIDGNKIFNCEFEKEMELVHFKVKINFESIEVYKNSKWNLYIRLKNKDIIIFEESLNHNDLRAFLFIN